MPFALILRGGDLLDHSVNPTRERVKQFGKHLGILPSSPGRDVKGMIGFLKEFERCTGAEFFAERFDERQVREAVAGSLQKQHRNLHIEKVLCALGRWLTRRMKREPWEDEAAHSGQRRHGLRL